jgi:hypothetical protein
MKEMNASWKLAIFRVSFGKSRIRYHRISANTSDGAFASLSAVCGATARR